MTVERTAYGFGAAIAEPYERVVDLSGGIERPAWCVGGRMNFLRRIGVTSRRLPSTVLPMPPSIA